MNLKQVIRRGFRAIISKKSTASPKNFASKNAQYDHETAEILKKVLLNTSNAIDIGCHKGDILTQIQKVAPNGTHFAFEPIPELYTYLTQHFPANCKIYNLALSNKKGEATFNHVVSNPGYSGLKKKGVMTESMKKSKALLFKQIYWIILFLLPLK